MRTKEKRGIRFFAILLVVAFGLMFAACSKVGLYHGLSEDEANEIIVLLNRNGIKANKAREVRHNEVFWIVEVADRDLVRARELLVSHNLPRKRQPGLTEVYKEKGMIPTPDEQKARFLLALKGEIINSLEALPEIVDADVVLNIPKQAEFVEPGVPQKRPSASVVIRARPPVGGQSPITEARIQRFVAHAVEGLDPRDVTVIISYQGEGGSAVSGSGEVVPVVSLGEKQAGAVEPELQEEGTAVVLGIAVEQDSKKKLKIYLVVFFSVLVVLSLSLIGMILYALRLRSRVQGKDLEQTPPVVEGNVVSEEASHQLAPPEGE